jgi:acetate---CoA ligase (ADP-forming)
MTLADPVRQLDAILRPRSVAVIGASNTPGKYGHEILKNIKEGGFQGTIYPINPKAETILSLSCYPSIGEAPEPPDLAVIIIPARAVPQAVRECGQRGARAAVIITGGFSEVGPEGQVLQHQTAEEASKWGIRILGPNCQGVNNPHHRLCASWPLLTCRGIVAVISQSGTVGAAMMDWFSEEKLGVSSCVAMGNRVDVDEADLIAYLNEDGNTAAIAAYIEGIKRPEKFVAAVEQLHKPLVVLKPGRTPKGKIAAESHTKSLAGADAIYESLFAKYDICRAYTVEEFYDFAKAFAYLKRPKGNRILFVTTSGGSAILATDQAEQEGLDAAPLPADLVETVSPLIPAHAIKTNPVDLTGDATAEMFAKVIAATRDHYDTVGVIFGDPIANASQAVTPGTNELVVFLGGAEVERRERELMHLKGVPVFPTPERGIKALARVVGRKALAPPQRPTLMNAATGRQLPPDKAMKLMAESGLSTPPLALATSASEAGRIAKEFGFPVVLKISSPDIVHKSDAGGVRLNVNSVKAVAKSYREIMTSARSAFPKARIDGVLVSKMAAPGREVIVGMNRDPQFGPIMLFGLGGIMVEIFRDVSLRPPPFTGEDALNMIREIKGYPVLAGYRGQPAIDEEALVCCLVRVSTIAEKHPEIHEIDLNPVLAYENAIMVVDARVIVK